MPQTPPATAEPEPALLTCKFDLTLLVDLEFPGRPAGPVTNGWLVETLRNLKHDIKADNARKDELRQQLEQCR
ncbi:MAG: hypothetical protein SV201_05730 [Pseudomonadota bacterium]|nr:hypothetical protein [Pseudomonadota bacterium]